MKLIPTPIATISLLVFVATSVLHAKSDKWTDTQGHTFRGTAEEVLGPIALFRTSATNSRKVPFRALSAESCRQFYEAVRSQPERAVHWSEGKGVVTAELRDRVKRVKDGKLVDAAVGAEPEPEFYMVLYVNSSVGDSWGLIGNVTETYNRLKTSHPGLVEGVFFGLHDNATDHANMATTMNVPWLVTHFREQHSIASLNDMAPSEGYALAIVTRTGLPLFGAANPDTDAVKKIMAEFEGLVSLLDPDNPRAWPDRAYYKKIVQPLRYAHGEAGPVLLGNPLRADGLRERKVTLVEARLEVAADGEVTAAEVRPDAGVPLNLVVPIADALKQGCVFVPAVKDGQFVAGTYAYRFEVGP